MLRGLQFEPWIAPVRHWRNRMDVACFIGYTRRRPGNELPPSVLQFLRHDGWIDAPGRPSSEQGADGIERLPEGIEHLPIPIDDWSMFERIFEVRTLPIDEDVPRVLPSYLAASVRSFFNQGGRRCIVIPVEHPTALYLRTNVPDRFAALEPLLPSLFGDLSAVEAADRGQWRGIGLLHGLDDVATLCLPDLPWLVGQVPPWLDIDPPPTVERDTFFECADPATTPLDALGPPPITIPRCDELEYQQWSRAVRTAGAFCAHHRRDVLLVAAIPMPTRDSRAHREPIDALLAWGIMNQGDEGRGPLSEHGLASRFVQLVYPWLGWSGSQGLPESLEPADGALAGVIARGTLLAGAFRSVAGRELYEIDRVEPRLSRAQQDREPEASGLPQSPREGALVKRISLVGPVTDRFELLSDVTSSGTPTYQLANIQRLHAVWIRALRQAGEALAFEPSNEGTWQQVRRQLQTVGLTLFRNGALRGQNATRAFSVRCDRTTMTRNDIDNGRLIAEIQYRPAAPLELIRVALALSENREVTIVSESSEPSS